MKVLLIGGTGVIGEGVVPELLARGHSVRLASRRADEHAQEWPERVEALAADVTDTATSLAAQLTRCGFVDTRVTGAFEGLGLMVTARRP